MRRPTHLDVIVWCQVSVLFAGSQIGTSQDQGIQQSVQSSETSHRQDDLPGLGELTNRVRNAKIGLAAFPDPLIVGGMYGGQLLTSAVELDPLMPETLDVYFAYWNVAARAHLLLSYAWTVTSADRPPVYSGLSDVDRTRQEAADAEQRVRILRVVAEGGYAKEWAAFVEAYRAFRIDASKSVPSNGVDWNVYVAVDKIARQHHLHELVGSLRVDPEHVAFEMLRLVGAARAKEQGVEEGLFYSCNSQIQLRTWHRFAPLLIRALGGSAEQRNAKVDEVIEAYGRLQTQFASWVQRHPEADDSEKSAFLHRASLDIGLLQMLEKLADHQELPE